MAIGADIIVKAASDLSNNIFGIVKQARDMIMMRESSYENDKRFAQEKEGILYQMALLKTRNEANTTWLVLGSLVFLLILVLIIKRNV